MNRQHLQGRQDNLELEARIANFELAARMQLAATDALDLTKESAATRASYGLDTTGDRHLRPQCLMARRLVERGVRFVQVMMSGQPWDTHSDNANQLRRLCRGTDGAGFGAAHRPETARPAGRDAGDLDRRVRPHAVRGRQGRPRPPQARLQPLGGGRRRQAAA